MANPYLVPCLEQLRAEFNALSPKRDKRSDGWIGDLPHQHEGGASDHNPRPDGAVLAVDIDSTGPWPESFDRYVQTIVDRQHAGYDTRLEYVIWDRRIASRDSGWRWETYTGTKDPHTGHSHFSARHDRTGNRSTAAWDPEGVADMTPAEVLAIHWGRGAKVLKLGDFPEVAADVAAVKADVAQMQADIAAIKDALAARP